MTSSRTSIAAFALTLMASGAALSQTATAPPRQLGGQQTTGDQAQDVSIGDLSDDSAPAPNAAPQRRTREQSPDVSTDDLADDNDQPESPKSAKQRKLSDAPAEDAYPDQVDPAPAVPRRGSVETAPLGSVSGPVVPKPEGVQVGTLGTIDESAGGVLDTSNGGLEQNIWSGSSRDKVDDLLNRVPLTSSDSAVRALARRVVLTKADAPPGDFHRAFAAIRLQKLLDAGMADDAGAFAIQIQAKEDADLARLQANALLLSGRKEVCGPQTAARTNLSDPFWLELRTYCAAVSGDTAMADLTRDVMSAQGLKDPAFDTLVADVVNGTKKPVDKIAKPTALHIYLLRKAGLPLPADIAKQPGPIVNVLILRDPKMSPEVRLAAAERALRTGAVSVNELKAVADAQVITAEQSAGAMAAAPKLPFLKAQALLRRAAQLESRPAQKAALVHEALTLGDKAGLFEIASHLQADVAVNIDAKTAAQSQGPLIGWALLLAGKTGAAAPWLGDNDIARAVLGLASNKDDTAQVALSDIAARVMKETDKAQNAARPMEALLLGAYDALGRTMPADAKAEASAIRAEHFSGRRPDDAAMQAILAAAAAPERKGEAILRVLDIAGPKGPGDLAPDITVEIVRALQEMGLKDTARSFAIHALMLYRPGTA